MEPDLVLDDLAPDVTPSAAIADAIRHALAAGRLQPGDRLPSQAALAEHYGVARETVRAALRLLDQDHLLERRQGARVTVRSAETPTLAALRTELVELQQSLHRSREELAATEKQVASALDRLADYDTDGS